MGTQIDPHKSSIGNMQANVMALLCYIAAAILSFIPGVRYVAWLAPIVIFFLEKESSFVKFHAMQSFVLNVIGVILGLIVSVLVRGIFMASRSITGALGAAALVGTLVTIISLIILVFAIIALIKAYKYTEYRIPLVGSIAAKLMNIGSMAKP